MEANVIKTFNKDVEKAVINYIKGEQPRKVINQPSKAVRSGLVNNEKEYTEYLNEFAIKLVSHKLKQSFEPEIPVIQAANAIEEIDKNINILYERLRELYTLYYPEAVRKVRDAKQLARLLEDPERKEVSKKLRITSKSIGYEYGKEEFEMIEEFADELGDLIELRKKLEDYVTMKMKKIAPKLSELAGPMLAARLITIAGSFKRLALMPSSTIQVLGAEKALFRHLRTGAKPPKHGIIIQHSSIQKAKKKDRGKAARKLSNKISIIVRSDYFENP